MPPPLPALKAFGHLSSMVFIFPCSPNPFDRHLLTFRGVVRTWKGELDAALLEFEKAQSSYFWYPRRSFAAGRPASGRVTIEVRTAT